MQTRRNHIACLLIFLLLSVVSFQSLAQKHIKNSNYELSEKDALDIITEFKRFNLSEKSFVANQAYSSQKVLFVDFDFQPHEEKKRYEKHYKLLCSKPKNEEWQCIKKEIVMITLGENLAKTIEVVDSFGIEISVFLDAVKVADYEKPMNMKYPIVRIKSKFFDEYIVTFANYKAYKIGQRYRLRKYCNLTLLHKQKKNENYFLIDWDDFAENGCVNYNY